MSKNKNYDYKKAENALRDAGSRCPEEIYSYSSDKAFRGYMKENGLNPDKYSKPNSHSSSGSFSGGSNFGGGNSSGSNEGGCYLTTACVVSKGLPDDCDELQTLRIFRDSYLISLDNGKEQVEEYYHMAPSVVSAINKGKNSSEIWSLVYDELVAPCVQMIKSGQNDSAYNHYRTYSMKLYAKYCN